MTSPAAVRWVGEHHSLGADEKVAFVAALTDLGYAKDHFRVTVVRIPKDGPLDKRARYNVFVDQLRNGTPYRGKPYLGGFQEDWVKQFGLDAPTHFPKM